MALSLMQLFDMKRLNVLDEDLKEILGDRCGRYVN